MKKLTFATIILFSLGLGACHYGQDEAKDTLERNELYKTDKADYSVNRAGEGGKMNVTATAPTDTVKPATEATKTEGAAEKK